MRFAFIRNIHYPTIRNPTPYQIFGIDAHSTVDKKKLKQTYYEFVKKYHPDIGSTGDAEKFKCIVNAHEILKNDSKRMRYDRASAFNGNSAGQQGYYQHKGNYKEYKEWSAEHQEQFDKGLQANKIWIVKVIVVSSFVFSVLNFTIMRKNTEARLDAVNKRSESIANELAERVRVGQGTSAEERIDRFLNTRKHALDRYGNKFSFKDVK